MSIAGLLQESEEGPVLQGQRLVKVCPHQAEVGGTDLGRHSHAQCSKLAYGFWKYILSSLSY